MPTSRFNSNKNYCNGQNYTYNKNIIDPLGEVFGFVNDGVYEFIKNIKDVVSNTYGNIDVKMDIFEYDNHYSIKMEIPGVAKEDIKIFMNNDNVLEISGNKKEIMPEEEGSIKLQSERKFGEFKKTITFGKKVDKEKITAKINDGELNITVVKAEEEKQKYKEIVID